MAGWVESLFHPANMGLTTAGPLKPLRIEVGDFALIQYNKLSFCLFLNRHYYFFCHIHLPWQT